MTSQSFNIGVPSIPGKPIRLRIQDVSKKGFQAKQHRFQSDRSRLVDQFIETFDNLHPAPEPLPKQQSAEQSTQASRQSYRSEYSQVRYVVPEYKNTLIDLLRKEQQEQKRLAIGKQQPVRRAVSLRSETNGRLMEFRRQEEEKQIMMQNYYFAERELERKHNPPALPKPSAIFLNESRDRVFERSLIYDDTLGPGYYPDQPPQPKPAARQQPPPPVSKEDKASDPSSLKKITNKVFNKYNIEAQQHRLPVPAPQVAKKPHSDYMFVSDDRDRFGDQIFPIVLKTNVPGPGAYNSVESIEQKAKKVIVLEEQRRLLKDWFNQ